MRFAPHTDDDVDQMLEAIGLSSVDDLFNRISRTVRLNRPLDLPEGVSEIQYLADLKALAGRNRSAEDLVCFAGGSALGFHVWRTWDRSYDDIPVPNVTISTDPAVVARGEYLVYGPSHCVECHSVLVRGISEGFLNGEKVPLRGGDEI